MLLMTAVRSAQNQQRMRQNRQNRMASSMYSGNRYSGARFNRSYTQRNVRPSIARPSHSQLIRPNFHSGGGNQYIIGSSMLRPSSLIPISNEERLQIDQADYRTKRGAKLLRDRQSAKGSAKVWGICLFITVVLFIALQVAAKTECKQSDETG